MADHEVAKRLNIQNSGEVDGPGQSEEADLQRAIRKEPDAHEGYIKLADFYRRSKRLEDAQQMLEKAAEITGGDSSVRELAEDVELELLGKNLATCPGECRGRCSQGAGPENRPGNASARDGSAAGPCRSVPG